MPALGSPLVREARRLANAYRSFPGPETTPPSEVLGWYEEHDPTSETNVRAALERGVTDPVGRREFLRRSAMVGAGALGASLLWKPSLASGARREAKVVVVGAGLAGLTCTYRLRRMGVDAVLHEAQDDVVGGRCRSLRGFFRERQTAEQGGQFIDSRHRHIRGLAAELGLPLVDSFEQSFPSGSQSYRWLNGALRSDDEVFANFGILQRRLERDYERVGSYVWNEAGPAARAIDRVSVIEWLDDNIPGGSRSLLGRWAGVFMQGFFGMEPGEMSMINLFEGLVVPYPGADERYRIAGGNDRVVHAMARKLRRVGALRQGSALFSARTRSDGRIAMLFTDRPYTEVVADRVVFALPFTTLRDVDLSGLSLSRRRRRAIDELAMGTNAKLNLQFDRPFARFDWDAGFSSDQPQYGTWDTTYGQSHPSFREPVLTVYNGGREGASYPTDVAHGPASDAIVARALANLERGVTGLSKAYNGKAWLASWVDDPWARGSYAGFGPGQYTAFWGFLAKAEDNVYFAGEHTSTHSQGYLNGGVESGERAARQVRRSLGV
ncbi:MAG TPA: FAD-dependent oxidoreductase [Actinomycetota bacterium]|jgi:monoamine oxidase|nr:FAD-dependent oxidoreductase [Actinomycetota bacterium]